MPATAIFLTVEEYTGIIDRLALLERTVHAQADALSEFQTTLQGLDSTVSAFQKTMAELPSQAGKAEQVSKGVQ